MCSPPPPRLERHPFGPLLGTGALGAAPRPPGRARQHTAALGPAGRPRRLACHALFFLLVPSTLARAIGPGVCAHSDGSEPGRHCRERAMGTPRARPLSPPAPSFLGRVVGLQIGVMTHPGGVHVGSGPLRFGRVICNFRTPIERVELSKFPFDIFLYNCFDISIYKFLFWLKLDWKSEFLDKPCLA